MGIFGKSAQQKRIDALVRDNRILESALASSETALAEERDAHSKSVDANLREIGRSNRLAGRLWSAHRALRDIKEMVTPSAAHAARKMAARADEALPEDMGGHPVGDGGSGFIKPTNGAAAQAAHHSV